VQEADGYLKNNENEKAQQLFREISNDYPKKKKGTPK